MTVMNSSSANEKFIKKVALKILPSPELKCKWVFIIKLHFPVKSTTHISLSEHYWEQSIKTAAD